MQHKKDIEHYLTESEKDEGGHWKIWHHEYQKLFKKLLNSPYGKYAYGQTQLWAYGSSELIS